MGFAGENAFGHRPITFPVAHLSYCSPAYDRRGSLSTEESV